MTAPDRYAAIPALGIAISILSGVVVAWLTDDWLLAVVIVVVVGLVQISRYRMRRLRNGWQTRSAPSNGDDRTH